MLGIGVTWTRSSKPHEATHDPVAKSKQPDIYPRGPLSY